MKFAVRSAQYKVIKRVIKKFDIALVSNKGFLFMDQDDFNKVHGEVGNLCKIQDTIGSVLLDKLELWEKCFIIMSDKSGYCETFAVYDEDFFLHCCHALDIYPVSVRLDYNPLDSIENCDSEKSDVLGFYRPELGDAYIEVKDND